MLLKWVPKAPIYDGHKGASHFIAARNGGGAHAPRVRRLRPSSTACGRATAPDATRDGAHLKCLITDSSQGVFFKNSTGTEVRVIRYLTCTQGTLLVLVPATLSGPQTLIVRVKFGSNLRQTTHDAVLVQS